MAPVALRHARHAAAGVAALALALAALAAPARAQFVCSFSDAGFGVDYDLSPMTLTSGADYQISSGGKTFYANVCGNTLQLHGCATASVAVMSDGTNCYPLQSDSIVFYSLLDDSQPEGGVHASFKPAMPANCHSGTAKKPYQLGMSFVCQPGQDTVLASVSPLGLDGCNYVLTFHSKYACPLSDQQTSAHKLSGGWVFVIIVLVVATVYVVVGCTYKWKRQGTTGVESCPNVDFWRTLPGLVKDGCVFSFQRARRLCGGTGGGSYEQVK